MKFELIGNQAKAAKSPTKRNGCYDFTISKGAMVCYHQALYEQPRRKLQSAIHDGNVLEKLRGRYYKIAYRMIRDNIHTIRLSIEEIENTQKAIDDIYMERKETLPRGQTKLSFDKEIYQLRANICTFYFRCALHSTQ